MSFDADVAAQESVLRRLLDVLRATDNPALGAVASLAVHRGPVIFAGMGSSLHAAGPAILRLSEAGRTAYAMEAGELLHYAVNAISSSALVVVISQSGRSAETLKLARRVSEVRGAAIVAVTNDEANPLAALANVTVPILAGDETTVSTKTFVTTLITLSAVADAIAGRTDRITDTAVAEGVPNLIDAVARDPYLASRAGAAFEQISALAIVARGPSLAAADYGALILKETARIPAESMAAGSFRHGPIEITGPRVGLIVLAPAGPTRELSVRLAMDAVASGSPTWLLINSGELQERPGLTVTTLPAVSEPLAPLVFSVPLQRLASDMARRNGWEPGVMRISNKVTDRE